MHDNDGIRIAILLFAVVVFSIGLVVPIFGTARPYRKKFGRVSWMMRSRLILRCSILLLAIHNIIPPLLREFFPGRLTHELLASMAQWGMFLYLFISLAMIHMWWRHPDGVKGL